MLITFNGEAI